MYDFSTKEHPYLRIACTGKVDAIACSPDGILCAAGIKEKIHIWEVGEGSLHQCSLVATHTFQCFSFMYFVFW